MLVDVKFCDNGLEAIVRCAKDICRVIVPMGSEAYEKSGREKARALAVKRFYEMADEYYTKGFSRDEVFQIGNIVELRNGDKYEIKEVKPYRNNDTVWIEAHRIGKEKGMRDRIIMESWDEFCFYGINTTMDIVKVFDSEGNLQAERTQYNVLSTKHFVYVD